MNAKELLSPWTLDPKPLHHPKSCASHGGKALLGCKNRVANGLRELKNQTTTGHAVRLGIHIEGEHERHQERLTHEHRGP